MMHVDITSRCVNGDFSVRILAGKPRLGPTLISVLSTLKRTQYREQLHVRYWHAISMLPRFREHA